MADERARYFRRLHRLRGSARRWSVLGGGLTAAAAVLTPYAGIGLADAAWAASAGASVALAVVAVERPPGARRRTGPARPRPGARRTSACIAAVERFPAGRTALQEVRRQNAPVRVARFDRRPSPGTASTGPRRPWPGCAGRLTGPGEAAVLEAAVAEQWLRDLGQRVASVERALPFAPRRPAARAGRGTPDPGRAVRRGRHGVRAAGRRPPPATSPRTAPGRRSTSTRRCPGSIEADRPAARRRRRPGRAAGLHLDRVPPRGHRPSPPPVTHRRR